MPPDDLGSKPPGHVRPTACTRRRAVLEACLGASVVCIAATNITGATAACAGVRPFIRLQSPVVIPLNVLAKPWEQVLFKARFTKRNGRDSLVPGLAVRLPGGAGVQAFCLYCPHELCMIDLTDAKELLCTCHHSTFDPLKRGAWVAGPALRSTYQFECEVTHDSLRVTGIEAGLEEKLL